MTIEFDKRQFKTGNNSLAELLMLDFIEKLVKAHNELEFRVDDHTSSLSNLEDLTGLDTIGTDEERTLEHRFKALEESSATQAMEIAELKAIVNPESIEYKTTTTLCAPTFKLRSDEDIKLIEQMKKDIRSFAHYIDSIICCRIDTFLVEEIRESNIFTYLKRRSDE